MKLVLSWAAKIASVTLTSGLLMSVSAVHAADVPKGPAMPDAKAGERLFNEGDLTRGIVACSSCHGAAGNSVLPENPNLAAQPHEYIYKQLTEFQPKAGSDVALRLGVGGNPAVMSAMVMPLTDEDMQNVSLYLAEQPLTSPSSASDEDLVSQGQQIWRGGIASKNVPACAACHLANGAGIPGEYPRLGGQFASYLEQQLELFRAGYRNNNEMMTDIAARLSDAEIKAVSDYAAGLR
ncbi:c-type cytochrome [Orrella sp. 11846]|uniref:c-type cytochrome n=1 Tax=Orrella sp. 11846 TaxID=3409913 RepID=UPI003B590C51